MRAGEDDQCFASGKRLPVAIGLCEMPLNQAVLTLVLHHQRKMRCHHAGIRPALRPEQNSERVSLHGFNEHSAVGNLVEFGRVHCDFDDTGEPNGGSCFPTLGAKTKTRRRWGTPGPEEGAQGNY